MTIDYDLLAELIKAKSGLTLDMSRMYDIDTISQKLMSLHGVTSSSELLQVLAVTQTSTFSWQLLLQNVTIGETYFFRNAAHFNILESSVLPELIQKRREQGFLYLNIWSAGCSTGEEPYSIAMLLKELLHDIDNWNVRILATDIDEHHLEIARAGRYRSNSFRTETRPHIKERYFDDVNGTYLISDDIKKLVRFMNLNLISDEYPAFSTQTIHQDIIFCRNVTIYFDEATTKSTVNRFYESLMDGGYLFVGHSEPSLTTYQAFETRNTNDAIVYQKLARVLPTPMIIVSTNNALEPTIKTQLTLQKTQPVEISQNTTLSVDIVQVKAAINRSDWDVALSLLAIFEQQAPMNSEVHYLRGLVLMNSGSLDAARQSLRRSLYCDPTFALAHYAMAEVYFQQDNAIQAKRCWLLSERAVAGLDEEVTLADDLTVGMFRDLINTRLTHQGEKIS